MSSQVRETGLPYLRLGGSAGWEPLLKARSMDLTAAEGAGLGVRGYEPIPGTEPLGSFGGRTLVHGTAIGPQGEVLIADPARRVVLVHRQPVYGEKPDPGTPDFRPLWPARDLPVGAEHDVSRPPHPPADPYTLVEPVDVAFCPNGDLVIADAAAGRLLVLAYPTAQLRRVVHLPNWAPVAVAFDAAGRCHVADRAGRTVHRFDSRWRRALHYPHPATVLVSPWQLAAVAGGAANCETTASYPCADASCATGQEVPAAPGPLLAVLDGDRVVLLDERGRMLPARTALPELAPPALRRAADGVLTWPDPAHHHLPLRLEGLEVGRDGVHAGTGHALLAVARRVRLPQSGRLRIGPLSGDGAGFAWDRLVLDAHIPQGTALMVSTLASDGALEPELLDAPGAGWSVPLALRPGEAPELLVQSRQGTHLWIDLEFRGTGMDTARLRRLDVFAPRSGSLRRLPPGYRQDAASADFLDRFLSYFDTVFAEVESEHRDMARLLDERTAPPGQALDWLGGWFGLRFDPGWDTATRRRSIAQAMVYRSERGSVPGLRRLLGWHTALPEPWPAIIEHFRVPVDAKLPIGRELLRDPGAAHQCTLVLPASAVSTPADRRALEELLAAHLPAHVRCRVRYIRPGVVIGAQSSLGVDMLLGGPPTPELGAGELGADAATAPETNQWIERARSAPC